jgi:chromosome segregation ATPase
MNSFYYAKQAIEELEVKLAATDDRLAKAEAENKSYREQIESLLVRLEKVEELLPKQPEEGDDRGIPMCDWD